MIRGTTHSQKALYFGDREAKCVGALRLQQTKRLGLRLRQVRCGVV